MRIFVVRRLATARRVSGARSTAIGSGAPEGRANGRPWARAAGAALVVLAMMAGIGPIAGVAQASALGTCTDSWVGPAKGTSSWSDAADWSRRSVPNTGTAVCINKSGTYTVVVVGYTPIGALHIGATSGDPTLELKGVGSDTFLGFASASTVGGVGRRGTLALNPSRSYDVALGGKGSLTITSGGRLSTFGPAGAKGALVQVPLVNQPGGTVALNAPSNTVEYGTGAVNSGTFKVARAAALAVESGSSFTQSAGTLAAEGAITLFNGTFTLAGGSASGGPVLLSNAALVDGLGSIGFNLTGTSSLSGNIPAGQTVTLATNDADTNVFLLGATTVRGALVIEPSATHSVALAGKGSLLIAPGGKLSTSGLAAGQPVYVRVALTNEAGGVVDLAAPSDFEYGPATVNSGTIDVVPGGELALSSGSTLTNEATGELGVTIDATTGLVSGISGPGESLDGTLAVTTLGSPSAGATYVVVDGPVTGKFSADAFGSHSYSVQYAAGTVSSNEVVLTAG